MKQARKNIFGKVYEFEWSSDFDSTLPPSIELYENASDSSRAEVKIIVSHALTDHTPLTINPKIHQYSQNEMRTIFDTVHASWRQDEDGALVIGMAVPSVTRMRRAARRLMSTEFSTETEHFEQLLHELILIPSVYFLDDVAPIHAAAIAKHSGAILWAGTGGAGKSSAVIAFRQHEDTSFIADDISVVSSAGVVYGNMAWPKIYGYNCTGNEMAREILKGRSVADRLHFHIRNHWNSSHVRRKIAPNRLYQSVTPTGSPLNNIAFLVRENVPAVTTSFLPIENAVEMAIAVMESEYGVFHMHLNWQEYNALANGSTPLLTMPQVREKWRKIYRAAFSKVRIFKISVPFEIEHICYQSEIVRLACEW